MDGQSTLEWNAPAPDALLPEENCSEVDALALWDEPGLMLTPTQVLGLLGVVVLLLLVLS